jgi:hypothetical protein
LSVARGVLSRQGRALAIPDEASRFITNIKPFDLSLFPLTRSSFASMKTIKLKATIKMKIEIHE